MWWLIPIVVLVAVLLVMGIFVFLGRFRGGRYLRPIMPVLLRTPLLGKALQKASRAALERENPALANAMRKLERAGVQKDPQRAARAKAAAPPSPPIAPSAERPANSAAKRPRSANLPR